nr:aldo/keto reductase [Haliea salexigens]
MQEVAIDTGLPAMQLALVWVLARPEIPSSIIGASKMQHREDAVVALEIELTTEDLARLEEVYRPRGVLGHQ